MNIREFDGCVPVPWIIRLYNDCYLIVWFFLAVSFHLFHDNLFMWWFVENLQMWYPPGNANISPISRHIWVNDDFPDFPFGGICDPPLEGSSKPLISSIAFEVRLLEPSLCLGRGRVRVGWDGQQSSSFWWCFMVKVSVSPEITGQQMMGKIKGHRGIAGWLMMKFENPTCHQIEFTKWRSF